MATTVTRTVNTDGGGDHLSAQLAEDWFTSNYPNFVSSDIEGVVNCSGSNDDITGLVAIGVTLSDTNDLTFIGEADGAWGETKYTVRKSGNLVLVAENYVRIRRMQCAITGTATGHGLYATSSDAHFYFNHVKQESASGTIMGIRTNTSAGTASNVIGNIIDGVTNIAAYLVVNAASTLLYAHNTAHGCAFYVAAGTANTVTAKNNTTVDCGTNYNGTFTAASSNNISSGAVVPGNNSLTNQVAADLMTDPANGDFTLKTGSNAIGAGVAISGLTTDITGNDWASPPSIGAFEYVAVGTVVNSDFAQVYDMVGAVNSSFSTVYDIRNAINSDLAIEYCINNIVASDFVLNYNILNLVLMDFAVPYDIKESVGSVISIVFDIRSATKSEIELIYNMAGTVFSDFTVRYDLGEIIITGTLSTGLNIGIGIRI